MRLSILAAATACAVYIGNPVAAVAQPSRPALDAATLYQQPTLDGTSLAFAYDRLTGITPDFRPYAERSMPARNAPPSTVMRSWRVRRPTTKPRSKVSTSPRCMWSASGPSSDSTTSLVAVTRFLSARTRSSQSPTRPPRSNMGSNSATRTR